MASTYLTKTFGAGNRKTWTWSAWIKVAQTSGAQRLFLGHNNTHPSTQINIEIGSIDNQFTTYNYDGATTNYILQTNRTLRDTSGWYHLVVSTDTTQATASDRLKMYVNGVQETSFNQSTYPSQNFDTQMNNNSAIAQVSGGGTPGSPFNGSMSHIHFIDGTAYDADTFGETDATTGIWKPKIAPSVTYGTNGFFLKFENSGAFGTDSSGNGNNFTVNGTMTQTIDTPSNVFATMNPLDYGSGTTSNATFSNGNTIITGNTTDWRHAHGTLGVSQGKWYYEAKAIGVPDGDTAIYIGWCDPLLSTTYGVNAFNTPFNIYAFTNGRIIFNTSYTDGYQAYADGDILGFALDLDNGKGYISRNGIYYNNNNTSSSPDTNNPDFTVTISSSGSGVLVPLGVGYNDGAVQFNFGNGYFGTTAVSSAQNPDDGIGIFEHDVPAGYKALCTKSINAQEYS